VLRESLRCVRGEVVLLSITQPGVVDNATVSGRLRGLDSRIRAQLAREQLRPPRRIVRVWQLQRRGALHLHLIFLSRVPDERARVRRYVELYRQHAADFALGWIDDPYRPRHPRRNGRPDRTRPRYTMEFPSAERAAAYLSGYLGGGQFLALLEGAVPESNVRPVWISPVLLRASGWTLERCRWVRQGWLITNSRWRLHRPEWDRWERTYPSWWYRPADREWVLRQLAPAP
jgi:hypothetical protein